MMGKGMALPINLCDKLAVISPPRRRSTWIDAVEEEPGHSNADIVDKSWTRGVQMTSESEDQGRESV